LHSNNAGFSKQNSIIFQVRRFPQTGPCVIGKSGGGLCCGNFKRNRHSISQTGVNS